MGPVKILLAEDNHLLRWWMQGSLEREGFFVVAPASAEEALRVARVYPFDVLITDWQLEAGCDGFDILRAMRQSDGATPALAVLISANADEALVTRGRAAGFDLVIRKPFPVADVVAAVQGAGRREEVLAS